MKGQIRLYCCGGAAVNNGAHFYKAEPTEGFADISACFIDTSLSNILGKNGISEDDVYLLSDVDGSGKLRASNYQEATKSVKSILHKFKPAEMNLVMFSASGGTGSVFGPLIAKELLEKGNPVICIVVGSEEAKITINNTVKTLQSLDQISRKQIGKPVVVSYFHNDDKVNRRVNDEAIRQTIIALSILSSRQNQELDTADVSNFIDFSKVTSVTEGLSFLYVTTKEEEAAKVEYPISIASLFSTYGDTTKVLNPEYSCAGYPKPGVIKEGDLHFVISQSKTKNIFQKLDSKLKEFEESSSARIAAQSLGGDADDNGMVL